MDDLKLFMKNNKLKRENTEYVATVALIDPETKEPLTWTIRSITTKESEKITNASFTMDTDTSRGRVTPRFNQELFKKKLICAAVVFPDLNNAELQDSYGVKCAEDLLVEMVDNPTEYNNLANFVNSYTGIKPITELVKEAKN